MRTIKYMQLFLVTKGLNVGNWKLIVTFTINNTDDDDDDDDNYNNN